MKKRTALVLIFALLISVIMPATNAQAAVSLSKKKVILEVGSSITLKMNGTKNTVTWKTSDKKIATVSKGKVTAVSAGTVKITATVAKKNYVCVVNVVDSSKKLADEFSEKGVIKKLKATKKAVITSGSYKYFIISIKNGSEYNINADLSIDMLDKNGDSVELRSAYLYNFAAGDEEIVAVMTDAKATDYAITYSVKEKAEITSLGNSIDVDAKLSGSNVVINVTNNGYSCAKSVEVSLLCYRDGEVCDYIRAYVNPSDHDGDYLNPGETVKTSRSVYKVDSVKVINISGYRYR